MTHTSLRFNIPSGQRLVLFLCITFLCVVFVAVISSIVMSGHESAARTRIVAILTDVIMFIIPALGTAVVITRMPADFLLISKAPKNNQILLTLATIIAAIPAMNIIVAWNASINLPESMVVIEDWMKTSETLAQQRTMELIGGTGVSSFVIAVLIIAVLAAFSEEIFFRGTLQRLLATSGLSTHVAVWATAFIFSAIHFQFFGFFPRLLLGAFFGYIVVWSGNLWLGVIAHFFNNFLAVYAMTIGKDTTFSEYAPPALEESLTPTAICIAAVSVTVTAILIYVIRKNFSRISCD